MSSPLGDMGLGEPTSRYGKEEKTAGRGQGQLRNEREGINRGEEKEGKKREGKG